MTVYAQNPDVVIRLLDDRRSQLNEAIRTVVRDIAVSAVNIESMQRQKDDLLAEQAQIEEGIEALKKARIRYEPQRPQRTSKQRKPTA